MNHFSYILAMNLLVCCAPCESGAIDDQVPVPPKFRVTYTDKWKPIWWWKPRVDGQGQFPLDAVTKFVDAFQTGDIAAALRVCAPTPESEASSEKSVVRQKKFPEFFEGISKSPIEHVVLANHAIKGKEGFWRVDYEVKFLNFDGYHYGFFDLRIEKSEWKVLDKPHWLDIANGQSKGHPRW